MSCVGRETWAVTPEVDKRGRGNKSEAGKATESSGFSNRPLQQAREIVLHSIDRANDVIHGRKHFDEALRLVLTAAQTSKSRDA